MTESEIADVLWEFESDPEARAMGALAFWESRAELDIELLVDLYRGDLQHLGWAAEATSRAVEALEGLNPERVAAFLTDLYSDRVDTGEQPEIGEFEPWLSADRFPALRAEFDPCHLGEVVEQRLEITKRLGHGTFGVVYKAVDRKSDRTIAVKSLRRYEGGFKTKDIELLAGEAIAAETIGFQGCPGQYEMLLGKDGHPYLLMEFIDGSSLRELIQAGPMDSVRAAAIMAAVCRTLANSHRRKVIHRDIKPENILIDEPGEVFLTDFGLALFEDEEQLGKEGEVAGTMGYVSPDALLGAANELDGRVDIWSVGIVLYEMLTGELPRRPTGKEEALVAAILAGHAELSFPDAVPKDIRKVIDGCIERNPVHRYATADEVADALESFASGESLPRGKKLLLAAWRQGTLFGKFQRHRDAVPNGPQALGGSDGERLAIATAMMFAMQEPLLDLRKLGQSLCAQDVLPADHAGKLAAALEAFPDSAASAIRSSFYTAQSMSPDRLEAAFVAVGELDAWVNATFDVIQELFESEGIPALATFELGLVSAQSCGPLAVPRSIEELATQTAMPETVWRRFADFVSGPTDDSIHEEFLRFGKSVERHILYGDA